MNQHLQNILNTIQQDKNLSEEEKNAILKSLKDADKEFEITSFKLDRTEKVKRTTAILLEETIEELEQKRKAVEAQNRELEIESSLERVRTVAMGMNKRDDMLDICRIISGQLQQLNVKDIRNVQTAIFYESKGTYLNFEYYAKHDKLLITEVDYKLHGVSERFANQMLRGAEELFTVNLKDQELKDWYAFQKTTNQFADVYLEKADSLNYYFYSLGPVALGISTYSPLNEDEITLFKRFRNVFELSYRRFIDIEKAIAQAKEALIETSLERVRAQAMAMRAPEDLTGICEVLYAELHTLGFIEIRNAMINIYDDEKKTFVNYDYSDVIGKSMNHLQYNVHPVVEKQIKQLRSAGDAFSETHFKGRDLEDWKAFRKEIGEKDDPRIDKADALHYYFYSIGTGSIGISTFSVIAEEKLNVLKRFRNVFNLSYQRYTDIALAEAQAHEAKIEASLERMRAAAMSMQKSDEIIHVSESMYKELTALGFTNIRNAQIAIQNDAKQAYTVFEFSDFAAGKGEAAYNSSHIVQELYNELGKTKDAFYQKEFSGNEFEEWRKWRKTLPVSSDSRIDTAASVCFYLYSFGTGHLGISTFNPITAAQIEILKRFKKVFELSYQRYTDVAKAEAQSKEAKIELALERVRARTMAMQKSDELGETAFVLFQQFEELGEDPEQIGIGIMNEEENVMDLWSTINGKLRDHVVKVSLDEPVLMRKLYAAYKVGEKTLVVDMSGDDLEKYNNYRNSIANVKIDVSRTKNRRVVSMAYFSKGLISLATPEPRPAETIQLLERFASVFDLTYTRFLDLKNAEAQTKESQIQLALERVRARTMAMQKSDELPDAANLLFQQVQSLGMPAWSAGYCIWNDNKQAVTLWMSSEGVLQPSFRAPLNEDPSFIHFLEAHQREETFFVEEIGGDKLVTHYKYMRGLPVVRKILDSIIEAGHPLPTFQIFHCAYFSQGFLLFITYEPVPEAHDIFKRFGKVFDQTYTRFLDLQKAEAQAREAQTEAALEKVRSRSLAMHKSDELNEVVTILFEKLKELQIPVTAVGIAINIEGSKDMNAYVCGENADGLIINNYRLPYFHHKIPEDFNNAREKQLDLFIGNYSKEEKNSFYKYVFEHTAELRHLPDDIKTMIFESPTYTITMLAVNNALFNINDFEGKILSENEVDIIKRFARVFDQAYTRFLDLQKAEAQSRESQIQLALERARSQSMIMQHSNELDDTLRVFHEQVLLLGINSAFSFLWLPDEDKERHIFWAAWEEDENGSGIFKSKAINYPLDRNEPATAQCLVDWKGTEPIVSYHVPPSGVESYFAAWQELIHGVDHLKPEYFSGGLYYVEAFMKYGCFGVMVTNDLTVDEKKILGRFAIEFERTYRRFLDLQKAEAQAREAQIEATLEKVRSRSLAMHKSEEILEVVRAVFERLSELNIELNSAFIIIFKENSRDTEWWLINKDKNEFSNVLVPYADFSFLKQMFEMRERGKELFSITYHREEKNELFRYLFTQTDFKYAPPERQQFIFNTQAMSISMAMTKKTAIQITRHYENPFSEEENDILKRFTKVFDQSYTRFLDLQKAEAQAREAKIEASLERVRSKAMSMQKSEDLAEAITIVFEELDKLDLGMLRCGIGILNKEKRTADVWTTTIADNNTVVQVAGDESMDIHPLLSGAFNAWLNHEDHSYTLKGEDLNNYYKAVAGENFKLPDSQSLVSKTEGIEQYYFNAVFSAGGLFAFRESPFPEEAKTILRRFADVFTLTYTRFSDLKQAEAQAKEARIEVALERVRSRTLAMQKSDELAETAAVLFRQLISLGIQPNRLYIAIVKDETGNAEFWITDEDGSKVSSAFETNLNDNPTFKKMFGGWKEEKKSLVIDMQGKELQEYFKYLTSIHVPFKGGLTQKRRLQDIAYFSKGFIGMASPDEQPAETLQLLERFAYTFNLTFTRFNDLKLAEAHAIQAEEDLIKLQTEKKRAEDALTELRSTQTQLIQSEKMASLGELTAGIAHEIQNPLNFVNNFSEVNTELIEEMKVEIEKGNMEEVKALANDIADNEQKINHHGKRADVIVKGMLQHSRSSSATKEPTDINKLADEYLRLAYHGLRAKEKSFNATLKTDYDESIGKINIIPQDIGRVILNLIINAFYVVAEKKKLHIDKYEPTVSISTKKINDKIEIKVADNGNGIPSKVLDKIFQPFFTTKPTGQGTGLGLSLSYDIVKAHGGELSVETTEGKGSTFIIQFNKI